MPARTKRAWSRAGAASPSPDQRPARICLAGARLAWRNVPVPALLVAALGLASSRALADKPEALSPQTLKLPTGPASLKGLGESFSPNIAVGGGSYSVPIELPPGFLAPKLSLSYSSGRGKGVLGLGWSLPVLQIYRTTDKGLPEYTPNDRFAVQGGEFNDELVLVDPVQRRYRLKNEGAFALFTHDPAVDTWTIAVASGETIHLGSTAAARQQSSSGTVRWFIARREDRFCHTSGSACEPHGVEYDYLTKNGHVYLSAIRYQLHAPSSKQNRVDFEYEARPDVFTDFTYGFADTTNERLARVAVNHGARVLRTYELDYDDLSLFSVLKSVKLTGEYGTEMPTLTFGYVPHSDSGTLVSMQQVPPLEGLLSGEARLEDVTGDGLPDLLIGAASNYRYYENLDGRHWATSPRSIANPPDRALYEPDVVLADANGDGFRDVVHKHDGRFRYYPGGDITEGRFNGFGPAVDLYTQAPFDEPLGSPWVKLTDLNADGRTDLLLQTPAGVQQVINTKDDRLEVSVSSPLPLDIDFSAPDLTLMDFNGDGHLDFVRKQISRHSGRVRVWFGLGYGRYTRENQMRQVPTGFDEELHLQDVNRDGQTDLVRISGSSVSYYLNTGQLSFTGPKGSYFGLPATYQTQKLVFADMNGNGTADVVWITQDYKLKYLDLMAEPHFGLLTRIDNGMGAVTTITYKSSTEYMIESKQAGVPWKTPMSSPMPVVARITVSDSFNLPGFTAQVSEIEYEYRDGYYDGKEREFRGFAHVVVTEKGETAHPTQVTETWLHVGRNLETGADEEILKGKAYQQLTRAADGDLYQSVATHWELRWLCQEDLAAGTARVLPECTSYGSDLQAHKDELVAFAIEREALAGTWEGTTTPRWAYTATTFDVWGNPTESTNYGEVTFALARQVGDAWAAADMDLYAGGDEVITIATFINDVGEWLVKIPYTTETGDLAGNLRAIERFYYDGTEYVGLPSGQVTAGKLMRKQAWLGYGGTPSEGRWVDVERHAYNNDGQLVGTLDAEDAARQLGYDEDTGSFVTSESVEVETRWIDPVTQDVEVDFQWLTATATYDTGLGQILTAEDFNGQETQLEYDDLGRITKIADPLSSLTVPTQRFGYVYGSSTYPISITTVEQLIDRAASGTYVTSKVYTDGQGRQRLRKSAAESPHGYVASGWLELSKRGKPLAVYDAFAGSGWAIEAPPSGTAVTRTEYDVLGRELAVLPPQTGATQTATRTRYLPWEVRVYDELDTAQAEWSYPATSKMDGLGRLVDIFKYNDRDEGVLGLTELHWKVGYDALGNITSIRDPKGSKAAGLGDNATAAAHTRLYLYDTLRRLRHIDDPNAGTLTYTFDDAGRLLSRVDALGQRIDNDYGRGGRLHATHTSLSASLLPDASYYFYYDQAGALLSGAQNLASRPSWISSPIGDVAWSYDEVGRPVTTVQSLLDPDFPNDPAVVFQAEATYDPQGKVLSESLPGGMELTSTYNTRQLRDLVTATLSGGGTYTVSAAYDVRGLRLRSDFGNELSTCNWYDARSRLAVDHTRPTSELGAVGSSGAGCGNKTATSTNAIVHRTYSYTLHGLIGQVTDLSPTRSELPRLGGTYQYDRLYELVQAETSAGTLEYAYDTIQNLVEITSSDPLNGRPAGALLYEGDGPNRVTSAFGDKFSYDAAGFMQSYNDFTLTFDVEGRLVEASKADGTLLRWWYDFAGERRVKITQIPGEADRVYRNPFPGYEERDGAPTWHVRDGRAIVMEVTLAPKPVPSLDELDNLITYGYDPESGLPPTPWQTDAVSLEEALEAYWSGQPPGDPVETAKYFHHDHLGGPSHATNTDGELVAYTSWHPYGLDWVHRGFQPNRGFTGAEREPERDLGLMQMGARWFAPRLGRWVSPDPEFVEDAKKALNSVLELNGYAYAGSNPVRFVDRDGRRIVLAENLTAEQKTVIMNNLQALTGDKLFLKGNEVRIRSLGEAEARGEGKVAGTQLVRRLRDSNKTVAIGMGESGKGSRMDCGGPCGSGEKPTDARVHFDPEDKSPTKLADGAGKVRFEREADRRFSLGHELIHSDRAMRGAAIPYEQTVLRTYDSSIGRVTQPVPREELATIGISDNKPQDITENQLRGEQGAPLRGEY